MLRPAANLEIPEETRKVAKAAFPKGNLLMTIRDEQGAIFEDEAFSGLYPGLGQLAESPARLVLVTVMQFMENLTDRQAAEAVGGWIDWKYALGLALINAGFDYSVLSEFRQRLIEGDGGQRLLETILNSCEAKGLLGGQKKQRTDSTQVSIRALNLVELVGETMRRVLDDLVRVAPEWLQTQIQQEWVKRNARPFDSYRLPKSKEKCESLAETIGQDGFTLLQATYEEDAPPEVKKLPRIEMMRRIWVQQYYW